VHRRHRAAAGGQRGHLTCGQIQLQSAGINRAACLACLACTTNFVYTSWIVPNICQTLPPSNPCMFIVRSGDEWQLQIELGVTIRGRSARRPANGKNAEGLLNVAGWRGGVGGVGKLRQRTSRTAGLRIGSPAAAAATGVEHVTVEEAGGVSAQHGPWPASSLGLGSVLQQHR
jgi:hypothetical protein